MKSFDFLAFFLGAFVMLLAVMLLRMSVVGAQPMVAAVGGLSLVMVALNVRALRARGKGADGS